MAELDEIIKKAIPYKSCPQDEVRNIMLRKWLLKEINRYIEYNYGQPVEPGSAPGANGGEAILPGMQSRN